jgi:hypothetical protein
MAADPHNTKAAFDKNYASATEVGEYVTRSNEGAWVLAPTVIRTALLGGCPALLELDQGGQKNYAFPPVPTSDPTSNFWFPPDRLRWVNALNPSMRREDFFDYPWPWELRAYLSPSEPWEFRDIDGRPLAREQVRSTLRVFLPRAVASQWGLLPPPQALSSEPPYAEPVPPPGPAAEDVGDEAGTKTAAIKTPARGSSESEWDPQLEWSVERVMQELKIKGWRQRGIIGAVENLPKSKLPKLKRYRGKTIPEILDGITAAALNRAVIAQGKPSSEDSCTKFLKAWKARRS